VNLTPLEAKVRTACIELLAAGVRPTGPELVVRIPWRSGDDLIRVRNRLVARGQLPHAAGRRSSPPKVRPAPARACDPEAVLAVCRTILAEGLRPTNARLAHRFRGCDPGELVRIRDEAIAAGLIEPGPIAPHGLSEAESEQVKERTEMVRREKIARGEVPMPVILRVVRDRQFDRWFVGRT
jgi:hypothetical protein